MLPTISEAVQLFRSRAATPGELLHDVLSTIDDRDPELGAFVSVDREGATHAAAAADGAWAAGTAGPLCGVPISVKDLIDVAGMPTGCGNPAPRPPAAEDATVVRLLREAGAVLLGKVHLHEFALGITGENPRLGTPRNPHNVSRLAGGSSSGSGVSVAAGMALASVGTDTGGSVRVPAALCGVVGFKPSFGRVSRRGVFPLSPSMDHVGLIARTAADAALLFSLLDREDPDDASTAGVPRESEPQPRSRERIALLEALHESASDEVRDLVERQLARLADLGVGTIERVQMPMHDELAWTYRTMVIAEAAAVHRQSRLGGSVTYGDDVDGMLSEGAALPATDYIESQQRRRAFAAECSRLLQRFDYLVCPTTLVTAPQRGAQEVEVRGQAMPVRSALLGNTSPFSMIGLPAISLPCAVAPGGLPVGLQVVGGRCRDLALLALASRIEQRI